MKISIEQLQMIGGDIGDDDWDNNEWWLMLTDDYVKW